MTYRAIKFEGSDVELPIEKVTVLRGIKNPTVFTIERIKDSEGFRLTYNSDVIPDLAKVSGMTIIREGDVRVTY